jgi:polysaccharide deacetylase family protein (PEP-CTERM system associated)
MSVTFTLDLEDHLGEYAPNGRYAENTRRVLAFLAERQVRGTFFVVGRVAESVPELVREVAAAGHEVACHSFRHIPLNRETPLSFRTDTLRAKHALEQAAGQEVLGYRAPIFSLTPATQWAVQELGELGFRYSSSVLPAAHPLHGFPSAPRMPFRWSTGLVEFPVPVVRFGPVALPFLGGIYLRYLPSGWIRRWSQRRSDSVLWTYVHPYDFDAEEPYAPLPDAATWVSILLWLNRRGTWRKLATVLESGVGTPLGDYAADPAFVSKLVSHSRASD